MALRGPVGRAAAAARPAGAVRTPRPSRTWPRRRARGALSCWSSTATWPWPAADIGREPAAQGQLALWIPSLGQEATGRLGRGDPRAGPHLPRLPQHVVARMRASTDADHRDARRLDHGGWDPKAHGNFHLYTLVIGSQALHATGLAMGVGLEGACGTGDVERDEAVVVYFGDGATSQGDVSEALVFAASYNTPQLFLLQNNHWAISVPVSRQSRVPLYRRAHGFGIPSLQVDGNDVLAMYAASRIYLDEARAGGGPRFIEALTYRMGAHTTSDDPTKYREDAEMQRWAGRDPIAQFEAYLRPRHRGGALRLRARGARPCRRRPAPSRSAAAARAMFDHVYTDPTPHRGSAPGSRSTRRRWAAPRERRDDDGEGPQRGPARNDGGGRARPAHGRGHRPPRRRLPRDRAAGPVRRAARARHPARRVGDRRHRDRAAMRGFRPVCEIQFDGFISRLRPDHHAAGQAHLAARWHTVSPVVIRVPTAATSAPSSTTRVARGLLRPHPGPAADEPGDPTRRLLDDPGGDRLARPVLFFGRRALLAQGRGRPDDPGAPRRSAASCARGPTRPDGHGAMVATLLAAAELPRRGHGPRGRRPALARRSTTATTHSSVRKTGRAIVAQEAPQDTSLGSEIAATIRSGRSSLQAPVIR